VSYELAHLNLALMREPLDHPLMAGFVDEGEAVNALARASDGFIWMPDDGAIGNAAAVFGDARALPNLSVWRSVTRLRQFVYEGQHGAAVRRRQEWFYPSRPAYVLWWVPSGHRPGLEEAKRRLDHLSAHGPSAYAFTFTEAKGPPRPGAADSLTTERLLLRPFARTDAEALHAVFSDPRVTASTNPGFVPTLDQVRAFIGRCEREWEEHAFSQWALCPRSDPAGVIGYCGFKPWERNESEVELLFGLSPAQWGQGLASEAARAASVFENNIPSRRVLENAGLQSSGTIATEHGREVFYRLPR
jgi:RimJ/RimL family protein N-acetyltransferase